MSLTAPRLPVRAAATTATGAALVVATVLGAAPSRAAVTGPEIRLEFEGGQLRTDSGGAAVDVAEVTNNGGGIRSVPSWDGTGSAAQFPAYQVDTPPQAALIAVDRDGVDDLDPGSSAFRFSAEFSLGSPSWGSSTDNGNNLVQRGVYTAETQYKLQVDYAHPECRVKGRSGAVSVRSSRAVTAGTWYRAVCTRVGTTVTLKVTQLNDGTTWTYQASGATGSMTPSSRTVPLAVGAKVSSTGALVTDNADQFNGMIDNVVLDIS